MEKEDLEFLLANVVSTDSSTLHLSAGHRPAMRRKGQLVRTDQHVVSAEELDGLGREFLFADHRGLLDAGEDVEFLYASTEGARFRTVVMRQSSGLSMAFHRIPTSIPSLRELCLPRVLSGFSGLSTGLIGVTGFLGSGKSTTVAAMVNYINQNSPKHIVLVESPIEFIHEPGRALVHQREVGFHVKSYASGVPEACRMGADVIVVGQVSDFETMNAILDATEKGVLVFTTVHASSAAAGLAEIQGLYKAEDRARMRARLATSLRVLMAQSLINHADGHSKIPLVEIMINSASIGRVIRGGQFHMLQESMKKCRGLGSQTTDMGLRELLSRQWITEDEAVFHAVDRDEVLGRRSGPQSVEPNTRGPVRRNSPV